MRLIDAGPMIALVNKSDDAAYKATRRFFKSSHYDYVTTLAVLSEAMHMAYRDGGWPAQNAVWQFCERQHIRIFSLDASHLARCRALMEQYQREPMDFGDASLAVAAEAMGVRQIVTIDKDFYVYRIHGKEVFDVIDPRS